ncbi:hypothetical protein [Sporosarcina sp. E16_8]|uniref:hypothetical protein n=1 Tax=Sporosarcina sp. E16_8 TaxID=2789295 RepID=UPI001A92A987|nr:hypothetical protein [Sporosarcina sp. E16_8]MBO0589062.1 hypothetical protein [Sporosarcina sp. E16_8]
METETTIKIQVQKVIDLVIEKKKQNEHKFLDTLLDRMKELLNILSNKEIDGLRKNLSISGAMRAYLDTYIVESYEEPLVIELDRLEKMLK